jgi:hypothetical protein
MLVSWKSSSDALLQKLLGSSPPEKRRLTILGLGLNPRMKFGNGQDRFVKGSLIVGGFGFSGVVKGGDLTAGGTSILKSGSPA